MDWLPLCGKTPLIVQLLELLKHSQNRGLLHKALQDSKSVAQLHHLRCVSAYGSRYHLFNTRRYLEKDNPIYLNFAHRVCR